MSLGLIHFWIGWINQSQLDPCYLKLHLNEIINYHDVKVSATWSQIGWFLHQVFYDGIINFCVVEASSQLRQSSQFGAMRQVPSRYRHGNIR